MSRTTTLLVSGYNMSITYDVTGGYKMSSINHGYRELPVVTGGK